MTTTRDDRLQVRIDATAKRRLEAAAGEMHLSVSAFVLQAAQERAERLLAERELVRLSPRATEVFSAALSRPAEVNTALLNTLDQPMKLAWLD